MMRLNFARRGGLAFAALTVALAAPMASATGDACGEITCVPLVVHEHNATVGTAHLGNNGGNACLHFQVMSGVEITRIDFAIVRDLANFPTVWSQDPAVGNYPVTQILNPPVTQATYCYPLAGLNLEPGDEVCLAALLTIRHIPTGLLFRAWATGDLIEDCGAYIFCHTVQECGGFRTQTQGGWGAPAQGNNPGTYLNANFAAAFPLGLTVGGGDCNGDTLLLTSAQAVRDALPGQGGGPAALGASSVDPASSGVNNLAAQTIALTLNLYFDLYDPDFGSSSNNLAELVVIDPASPCFGMTVTEVMNEANNVLAGCPSTFSASDIADCAAAINENYIDGEQDNGFLGLP